ncbi:MAG: FKBP-type peptidyl-prolyl cis-trans isomerase [Planctomycetaceae bacterium]|jgi:FKBP-type peptidyl-prolyl cis-trans isomerase|nr:FKBP-type peptidyl-prolyl cis-trans isomerase [Phycisphaerales bacterium]MCE2652731.1 FKBP-type peptidyl-prolyl cis-trans isomerase [Planctomycetaceae bacterium]
MSQSGSPSSSGPKTLPGGVVVEDLVVGTGVTCKAGAVVTVHYRGTLTSGKVFDESFGGDPVEFPLDQLIEGWQDGIPGMKVGGRRKLTVPWQKAYGAEGMPPEIPPKANLVFEIELLDVD